MEPSLRAFLAGLIDYAGMFPPASLALEPAVHNFAAYRAGPDAWMLGRFICPAERLEALGDETEVVNGTGAEGTKFAAPMAVAVLGVRSADAGAFARGLHSAIDAIVRFRERFSERATIDVLEAPLPPLALPPETLDEVTSFAGAHQVRVFLEVTTPLGTGWERAVDIALDTIARCRIAEADVGFKLRTGGVTADAFPSVGQVAHVLIACRDRSVPLKCTAGLHHPMRQYRDEVGTTMHGFLNVFVAGILAHSARLDQATVAAILAEEDPAAFNFADGHLGWRTYRTHADLVAQLRETALISFGSCSFDEPRDDLRALGVLP